MEKYKNHTKFIQSSCNSLCVSCNFLYTSFSFQYISHAFLLHGSYPDGKLQTFCMFLVTLCIFLVELYKVLVTLRCLAGTPYVLWDITNFLYTSCRNIQGFCNSLYSGKNVGGVCNFLYVSCRFIRRSCNLPGSEVLIHAYRILQSSFIPSRMGEWFLRVRKSKRKDLAT